MIYIEHQNFSRNQMEFSVKRVNDYLKSHDNPLSIKSKGSTSRSNNNDITIDGYQFWVYENISNPLDMGYYAVSLLANKGIVTLPKEDNKYIMGNLDLRNNCFHKASSLQTFFHTIGII